MRRQWVPGLFFSRAYAHAREKRPGDEANILLHTTKCIPHVHRSQKVFIRCYVLPSMAYPIHNPDSSLVPRPALSLRLEVTILEAGKKELAKREA